MNDKAAQTASGWGRSSEASRDATPTVCGGGTVPCFQGASPRGPSLYPGGTPPPGPHHSQRTGLGQLPSPAPRGPPFFGSGRPFPDPGAGAVAWATSRQFHSLATRCRAGSARGPQGLGGGAAGGGAGTPALPAGRPAGKGGVLRLGPERGTLALGEEQPRFAGSKLWPFEGGAHSTQSSGGR